PALGIWLEVVTLVIPGVNDGEGELTSIAKFLASVSRDIPWHVTAFHPDYKMGRTPATGAASLNLGWEIGKAAGLRYVYSGNRPGEVGDTENTRCPACAGLLIERRGFLVLQDRLGPSGRCPDCGHPIPGVWRVPDPGKEVPAGARPRA
ncbi:MAG TPA: hypothetical protein VFR02_00345, partial [bacterium]|nr:hypothetical protein [bacterium]